MYPHRQLELKKLQQLKDEVGELSAGDEARWRVLVRQCERELLQAADVVCCTCVGAGDPRVARLHFRALLVDESTQATEPECLIPVVTGVRQVHWVVLVGTRRSHADSSCSSATTASSARWSCARRRRARAWGSRCLSASWRWASAPSGCRCSTGCTRPSAPSPATSSTRAVCRTASPRVGRVCPRVTVLDAPPRSAERVLPGVDFAWPQPERPTFFWTVAGQEEIASSGTSYLNRAEAAAIEKLVTKLLRLGLKPEQVGVITPYEGQRAYIVQYMAHHGALHAKLYLDVEVASVDAFQVRF